jgi:hypothetical protein
MNLDDCKVCTQEHATHLREHEAQHQPITAIRDGWTLNSGDLYLLVRLPDGTETAVTVPRYKATGARKHTAL